MNTPLAQTKAIHEDIKQALAEIAKKHGLETCQLGKITYDENGFKSSLDVVFAGGDSKEMAKLRMMVGSLGLKEDVCNAEVLYSNGRYKVIGMRKTNLVLESAGKTYTAPVKAVVKSIQHYHPELCL